MRAVLRNLESSVLTTKKKKPSAFYDSEPPYAARVIRNVSVGLHVQYVCGTSITIFVYSPAFKLPLTCNFAYYVCDMTAFDAL